MRFTLATLALFVGLAGTTRTDLALAADSAEEVVSGRVQDRTGKGLAAAVVFAVEKGSGRVQQTTRADASGGFSLALPARSVYQFGAIVAGHELSEFRRTGPDRLVLIMQPIPPFDDESAAVSWSDNSPPWATAPSLDEAAHPAVQFVAGRVRDEGNQWLAGVRIFALLDNPPRTVAATTTDQGGNYLLPLAAGAYRLVARSTGLKLLTSHLTGRGLDMVMTIDSATQTVRVFSAAQPHGLVLHFRMNDSPDPEFVPPPQVETWLDSSWGRLKPKPACKETTSQWIRRRHVPKYWWLLLLQIPPPNPARTMGVAEPCYDIPAIRPLGSQQHNRLDTMPWR